MRDTVPCGIPCRAGYLGPRVEDVVCRLRDRRHHHQRAVVAHIVRVRAFDDELPRQSRVPREEDGDVRAVAQQRAADVARRDDQAGRGGRREDAAHQVGREAVQVQPALLRVCRVAVQRARRPNRLHRRRCGARVLAGCSESIAGTVSVRHSPQRCCAIEVDEAEAVGVRRRGRPDATCHVSPLSKEMTVLISGLPSASMLTWSSSFAISTPSTPCTCNIPEHSLPSVSDCLGAKPSTDQYRSARHCLRIPAAAGVPLERRLYAPCHSAPSSHTVASGCDAFACCCIAARWPIHVASCRLACCTDAPTWWKSQ